jgi:hypothetical protein
MCSLLHHYIVSPVNLFDNTTDDSISIRYQKERRFDLLIHNIKTFPKMNISGLPNVNHFAIGKIGIPFTSAVNVGETFVNKSHWVGKCCDCFLCWYFFLREQSFGPSFDGFLVDYLRPILLVLQLSHSKIPQFLCDNILGHFDWRMKIAMITLVETLVQMGLH